MELYWVIKSLAIILGETQLNRTYLEATDLHCHK